MTSITWAGPRYVQELGTFSGSQNRTQRGCVQYQNIPKIKNNIFKYFYTNNKSEILKSVQNIYLVLRLFVLHALLDNSYI